MKISYKLPEEVGVSSKSINGFINKLDKLGIPMHSLILARNGHIITEGYYWPYDKDTLHRSFSITKSFSAIAIGLLIEEGKVSLDSKIVDYFPEKLPANPHPWISELTIKQMLQMETCHSNTTYKIDPSKDWVESFFLTEPSHQPGTVFIYDTSSSHTLCALVEKISGKSMLDYMKEKFLDKLDFSRDSYIIKDPFGVSMGGSGLMATPMDLMKFALTIRSKGMVDGKELVPKWYIEEATKGQTDNLVNGQVLEERQGYGYQFWSTRHGGFSCYGMGGQFAIFLPEEDLILITTADTQDIKGGEQLIVDTFFDEILANLSSQPLAADDEEGRRLKETIKNLAIKPLKGEKTSPIIESVNGKPINLNKNKSGFISLSLEFEENFKKGKLILKDDKASHTIDFAMGDMALSKFPIYNQRCASSGVWLKENKLYIKSHIIDECIGSVHFHITFQEDDVSLYMKKIEETMFNEFKGFASGTFRY